MFIRNFYRLNLLETIQPMWLWVELKKSDKKNSGK
jgi:hypothetical protein